jgi:hypothetical protein
LKGVVSVVGVATACLALVVGSAYWYRAKWLSEAETLCRGADELVESRASRQKVVAELGVPSTEFGPQDWSSIERAFGSASGGAKVADVKKRLEPSGRLLVYSTSNAVMFVYLNGNQQITHASCFLQ